ncbi:proteophosphoglycan ppg4 [Rhodotorula toruloides]|uniref:Proteophosphoglycan ppg4 n=1 Tax=Rhodotorula toruloides TaxID=5286 RepID=A0A511KFE8_RHOTO|nr:proteophosphoglycan ppg4 [Rhodotorula toruloides]
MPHSPSHASLPTHSGTATTAHSHEDSQRHAVAAQAVASSQQPLAADQALLTPSLESILAAFNKDGKGDGELLKLIVQAKAKEDERLAALDVLRAEQVRLAQTYAVVHLYSQQAQVLALHSTWKGPPPYSPLSPPPSDYNGATVGVKRGRTPSDASTASDAAKAKSKKAKTAAAPPAVVPAPVPPAKPTRADVMAALRLKCEANQRTSQHVSHTRTSPSLSPPLSSARRTTPPKAPSARHTPFLRPAAPPSSASPPPPPLPASTDSSSRNKLALLLHASESSAALAPEWHPMPVATSDVRGAQEEASVKP